MCMIDLVNEYVGHPDNVSFAGVKSNILSKRVGALQVFGIRPQPSILNKCRKTLFHMWTDGSLTFSLQDLFQDV